MRLGQVSVRSFAELFSQTDICVYFRAPFFFSLISCKQGRAGGLLIPRMSAEACVVLTRYKRHTNSSIPRQGDNAPG